MPRTARASSVGRSERRKEGPQKLCGLALYVDDHELPGAWHGVTVRSSVPHARIKALRFDPAFPWKECVVVTAKDVPGENFVQLIDTDQPVLADGLTKHPAEPLALIAHPDKAKAYEAARRVTVEYEPLPAVLTIEESLAKKQLLYRDDNIFKSFLIRKGDLERGFAQADFVVEGEYKVPHQEQAYIENNGMAAWVEKDGSLVVLGSMQCPYYIQKALVKVFHLPAEKVRIVQAVTGGGFGGKEEYPSILAAHVALLALKAGRPVKMIYDRHEDMAATTKRHPAVVRHKTGITKDGRLVAQDVEVLMDGGAYLTLSPVVLSRGTLHATGPYECPNVRVTSKAVATNSPPNGAFRGFGAPQTLFAAELHFETLARATGLDALTLRRKNLFKTGSVTATGQVLKESVGSQEVLERTVKSSSYEKLRRDCAAWNKDPKKPTWRGAGLAVCHHGAGFTGSGEVMLASRAGVSLTKDGRVQVLAASTEIGQGTNTIFAQIAADTLGVDFDRVEVETPDTSKVPNSGPTVASRTCMVVGGLVKRAAQQLADALDAGKLSVKTPADAKKAAKALLNGDAIKRWIVEYQPPPGVKWDDTTYQGEAYGCYSYGCVAAEVEVDKTTYEVRVRKLWTAQDIGKAVNPLFAEGQIIGGTAQAVGYAVLEKAVYKDGLMQNSQLTNYIIPTALDTPPMEVTIVEKPYSGGPFGAKGVGELPMDVPGPAIAAAIHQAIGWLVPELPIMPEDICRVMSAGRPE
jgi:CO/xanthine dehydrogenase Mo-binding subunit